MSQSTSPSMAPEAPGRKEAARRLVIGGVAMALVFSASAFGLTQCAKAPRNAAGDGGGMGAGPPGRGGGPGGPAGAGRRPPTTVGVATASLGEAPVDVSALGSVSPLATVQMTPRVGGQLQRILFKEGQLVRRGQLLAVIDPRPFEISVKQAEAQLARDRAQLETARRDLERYRVLRGQDAIAGQTADNQLSLVQQDEAIVRADEASLGAARLNLSFTQITAPVNGRVGLRQVDPGNQITANQATPVAVVTQLDPINVLFSLPDTVIGALTSRHGGAGLPVTVLDRSGQVALAKGALATIDNQIDATTGTVKAKAVFRNADGKLFPNQFVNVSLRVDTLHDQVLIPTTAIRHGAKGDYVWVVEPDKTVKARPVTLGPSTAETTAVASGLSKGMTVVTDGGDRLRDGAKVNLPGPQSGGPGPAAGSGGRHGPRAKPGAGGPQ